MNPMTWDGPRIYVYLALFVIVFLRASATYWLGRGAGRLADRKLAEIVARPSYQRARSLLNRYGAPLVSICFLTVGLQTMVLIAAGMSRMPLRRFIPAQVVGCILWALLYGTVGFVGFKAAVMLYEASPALFLAAVGLLVAIIVFAVTNGRRAQRAQLAAAVAE